MAEFVADLRDIHFVLFEQLDLEPLFASEVYGAFSADDVGAIIDEAYRLSREVFAPINAAADQQGCRFADGQVTVPEVYRQAYKQYTEGGWLALNHRTEFGGQGAPEALKVAVDELFFGSCIALNLGMLLTPGAAHLIEAFGTPTLRQTYVRRMYSGQWAGTMCLTEPQAGSDVGASTTSARRVPGAEHFLIEGQKIFITFGEHDLTENIVHCVLARIEGAPAGTRGLSLFAVPKYRVDSQGKLGPHNDVACVGIEHKLGIHGSPTCTMAFGTNGQCHGWLIGEENQGMRCMFQMMNEARISVGLQGAALGNAAYQQALAYACERKQGAEVARMKDADAPRALIIRHPDVRVNLMRQKAYGEGCRALLLHAAYCADRAKAASDPAERKRWHGLLELLTPICKAYASDMGFRITEWALQTYGGYGYLRDYPAEQYLRDCKIASLYEGTNGIQALDLVGRKLGLDGGAHVMALAGRIHETIKKTEGTPLATLGAQLGAASKAWQQVNMAFVAALQNKRPLQPLVAATNYLALMGDLLVGYLLLDQALLATQKLAAVCEKAKVDPTSAAAVRGLALGNAEACYLDGKIKTAQFFFANELPNVRARSEAILAADMSALELVFPNELHLS